MRRIIERVVTVVTTTTWTIYWREDPPPSDPQADPDMDGKPRLLAVDDAQQFHESEDTTLAKEADLLKEESTNRSLPDQP